MAKRKIIILGAGLAGLSAAWHLQRKGISCQIFEKESEVGGLCRTKKINGFTFDHDGHLLHFKHRSIFDLVRGLLGNNLMRHTRSSWIHSFGRTTRYPFQANLQGLPPPILKECLAGFVRARKKKSFKSAQNFSQWIYQTFGDGIARHFMVPYNAKFWTVPPQQLTCEWLDGMVPVPSLSQVVAGATGGRKNHLGYNVHFWYPKKGGIHQLPQAFARRIKGICAGVEILKIDLAGKKLQRASGGTEKFDYLISTIPLPEMSFMIKDLPDAIRSALNQLRWNSIFNLNLGVSGKDAIKRHWVYFPQKENCFFRVGFPHHFSSSLTPAGRRSLYAEVSYSKDQPVSKRTLVPRIIRDLREVGILSKTDRIYAKDVNDIEYGYPLYDRHYHGARKKVVDFLTRQGIIPCGRYGSWKYFSMEDAILDGKRAAELIVARGRGPR